MPPVRDVLPIDSALPELRRALAEGVSALLQAPPGAGKTTGIPLALAEEPWLAGQRILMLEPRRLAARAAARWMAHTLGDPVGGTVGFRVRHETRIGPRTRIEVVTEGILTRMLLADPALEDVGLVIFDEFHERSIHADLGLALALHSREVLREDLRILVMSATLDGVAVAGLLDDAPVVTSPGLSFPIETRYLPPGPDIRPEAAAAAAVRDIMAGEPGDVLVFLPGTGEIRRAEAMLAGLDAEVIALHGNLPPEAQDRAIRPAPPGRRKVVLGTSIAETSLTIEGVRIVVDAGWSRVPRYSPRTGMTRLATVRVSRASADQRRGRAGRLGPGLCLRLWSAQEQHGLVPRSTPEILDADLAPLALDLAAAGVSDPSELRWLDPPPPPAFREARSLLVQLGAVAEGGPITPHGRAMARRALHPRLAHMALKGLELGLTDEACDLAALLSERDVLRRDESVPEADIRLRLDLLRGGTARYAVDHDALRRVHAEARACRDAGGRRGPGEASVGILLSFAYPDRVAQRRPGAAGRYLLRNGLGGFLEPQALAREAYLAVAAIEGRGREGRVLLAAPLGLEEVERHFGADVVREETVLWDPASRAVLARRRERLGALVLREGPARDPDPVLVTSALLAGIREMGMDTLPWTAVSRGVQARTGFLRRLEEGWPDLSDEALAATAEEWLGPRIAGLRRLDQLAAIDLAGILFERLGPERRARLENLAPSHLVVPSGSHIAVDYSDPEHPALAVRLQEVFGWTESPRVGGGRVPVTLHLLSPASRPVQVTRDLAGFWRTTYFEVRKDLRGRYPRHPWPDDPLAAQPTRRAKPRRKPGNRG
ncbi:MAG TPA: ATP-dependent helicase HrpB [Gemmatimonadales bacterium]|nr:ATP-dependent helicase HrpB [Gemmatimonadales bacterium]